MDVTAEVPVACYPAGQEPDRARVAGVDLGIIHPYAVAGPGGQALLVSGRAIRAEHRMHLADTKARARAVARRAPKPGQKGSRRWRHYRRRQRLTEARHGRRVCQAQHEAAKSAITWAVDRRVGTLAVGDPRGVLNLTAGRRHNQRTRDWRIGHLITVLTDKAEAAAISVQLMDERGTSSTCPACRSRIPKPAGRALTCPACQFTGHRDLTAAASIAAKTRRRYHAGHPGRRHAPPRWGAPSAVCAGGARVPAPGCSCGPGPGMRGRPGRSGTGRPSSRAEGTGDGQGGVPAAGARPAPGHLVTALTGLREPIVVLLLIIGFMSWISGKPLDGLLIMLAGAGLAWDAGRRSRQTSPAVVSPAEASAAAASPAEASPAEAGPAEASPVEAEPGGPGRTPS